MIHGGINLNGWFFGGGARAPFDYVAAKLTTPTEANVGGWIHTVLGGVMMGGLMMARHHLSLVALTPHRLSRIYDLANGPVVVQYIYSLAMQIADRQIRPTALFLRARPFFLGLIIGQFASAGAWHH